MSGFQILTVDKLEKSLSGTGKDKEELRLKGKMNWVQWDIRIKMSLGMSACKELLKGVPAQKDKSRWTWKKVDEQVANFLLQTCDFDIASAFYHLIDDDLAAPFTHNVYTALKRAYGSTDAQYQFALGRKFIDNRCSEMGDVNAWVNEIRAQYRELSTLKFDLSALCINVILNGLPSRLDAFADSVFATEETPTIDSICERLLRVDAGQKNREMQESSGDPATALSARRFNNRRSPAKSKSSAGPSKANPCNYCGSFLHWQNDCPDFRKSQNENEDPQSHIAKAFASFSTSDTASALPIDPDSDIGIANAF